MRSVPREARRSLALVLAAAAVAAAVIAGAGDGTTARASANVTITARDFFFSPDAVDVEVGDTVTWTNEQGFHNVKLGDARLNQPGFPSDPAWNPPPQRTFAEPGSYTFVCEVHPGMTGTVNVGGGEPTPTPTPTPAVPPPGSGPGDATPPSISELAVEGRSGAVSVQLAVSERATVNVRFAAADGIVAMRHQVEAGGWTLERPLDPGTYAYEVWAVDAMGNRSATRSGEVKVRG